MADPGRQTGRGAASVLIALFLAALALRPDIIGVGPILEDIRTDLDASRSVIGLLPTVPVLCMGLFAPLGGRLAARIGARSGVLVGLLLIAAAGLTRATMPTALLIAGVTIVVGLGVALVQTVLPALIKQQEAVDSTLATTVYVVGIQLGAAGSAAVSGPVAALGDWRWPLVLFGAAAGVWALVWFLLAPRGVELGNADGGPSDPRGLVALFREPIVRRVAAAYGLQSIAFYGTNAWLAPYFIEQGWDVVTAGRAVSVLNLAALTATLSVPLVMRALQERRRALILSAMLVVVGLALITMVGEDAWWVSIPLGLGLGPLLPLTLTLPIDVTDDVEVVARVTGGMLGVGYMLAALAPTGLGFVRDVSGSFTPVLLLLAAVTIAFALVCTTLGPGALRRGVRQDPEGLGSLGSEERPSGTTDGRRPGGSEGS